MQVSTGTLLIAAAVLGAGAFALLRDPSPPDTATAQDPASLAAAHGGQTPEPPAGEAVDPGANAGDPGSLPVDPMEPQPDEEAPAITWTAPAAWRSAPNPTTMRIATYAVPRVAGDPADAEVSVTRAGGGVDANVTRWASQFSGGTEPQRSTERVRGLAVTVVEMEGTYTSGMEERPEPHPAWALLAAIVQTPGEPYFFKMVGPAATVRAARPAMEALLASLSPPNSGDAGPEGGQTGGSRRR